jgi:hypothetical protein
MAGGELALRQPARDGFGYCLVFTNRNNQLWIVNTSYAAFGGDFFELDTLRFAAK